MAEAAVVYVPVLPSLRGVGAAMTAGFTKAGNQAGADAGRAAGIGMGPPLSRGAAKAGTAAAGVAARATGTAIRAPLTKGMTQAGASAGAAGGRAAGAAIRQPLTQAARDAGDDAGTGMGASMRGAFSRVTPKIIAIGGLVGTGISKAVVGALDIQQGQAKLATQLDLTATQSKRYGRLAGEVFSGGFGDSLDGVNDALAAVSLNIGSTVTASDKSLKWVTGSVLTLANAFGVDVVESSRAAGQLIKTGMAKNATAALDLITAGLGSVANKSGDVLDTFNEYSTQFRKLGLSGKDALGLISQMVQGGARDSDVAADALKEFAIRAIDGSATTVDGFKAIGLNADNMAKRIAQGGPTARKAFDETLTALNSVNDPLKRSRALTNLFGTQLEDLGGAFTKANLDTAANSLKNVDGSMSRANDRFDTAKSRLESVGREVMVAGSNFVQWLIPGLSKAASIASGVFGPALSWVGDVLGPLGPDVANAGVALAGLGVGAAVVKRLGGSVLGFTKNTAGAVKGTYQFVRGITSSGYAAQRGASTAARYGGAVRGVVGVVGNWTKAIVTSGARLVWQGAVAAGTAAKTVVLKTAQFGAMLASRAWAGAQALLNSQVVRTGVQSMLSGARVVAFKAVQLGIRGATLAWAGAQRILNFALKANPIGIVITALAALAAGLVWAWKHSETFRNIVTGAWNGIKTAAVWAWNNVLKPIFSALGTAVRAVGDVFSWLYHNIFKPVWDGISKAFSWVWDHVLHPGLVAIRTMARQVGDGFKKMRDIVVGAFNTLVDFVKKPIQVVIDVVWNNSLRWLFEKASKIPGIGAGVPDFLTKRITLSKGGMLPGYAPGRDTIPAALSPGEGVLVPELAALIGRRRLDAANAAAMSGRAMGRSADPMAPAVQAIMEFFATGGTAGRRAGRAPAATSTRRSKRTPARSKVIDLVKVISAKAVQVYGTGVTSKKTSTTTKKSTGKTTAKGSTGAKVVKAAVSTPAATKPAAVVKPAATSKAISTTAAGTQQLDRISGVLTRTMGQLQTSTGGYTDSVRNLERAGFSPLRTALVAKTVPAFRQVVLQHQAATRSTGKLRAAQGPLAASVRSAGTSQRREAALTTARVVSATGTQMNRNRQLAATATRSQASISHAASTSAARQRTAASSVNAALTSTRRALMFTADVATDQFGRIYGAAARPMRRVITGPLNAIVKVWNRLAGDFALKPKKLAMLVPGFQSGGHIGSVIGRIPGTGRGDKVPIMAESQEVMWDRGAVKAAGGPAAVDALRMGFRSGRLSTMDNPMAGSLSAADRFRAMRRVPIDDVPVGWKYGGVLPHVALAGDLVTKVFGPMPGGIGGVGARPNASDHPLGLALDFMVLQNRALGDKVAGFLQTRAAQLQVKYLIWKQMINQGSGWEGMEDRGSITANHFDHVHASFLRAGEQGRGFIGANPFDPAAVVNPAFAGIGKKITSFAHEFGGNRIAEIATGVARKALDGVKAFAVKQLGALGGGGGGAAAGPLKAYAKAMLGSFGWGPEQFGPLDSLWTKESGWRVTADNPDSSAYGIPQALPGNKMAAAGPDWATNGRTQIRWGLGYIKGRYGSPAAAWAHSQAVNWYDRGGDWQPGTLGFNGTGRVEKVLDPRASVAYERGLPFMEKIARLPRQRALSMVAGDRGLTVNQHNEFHGILDPEAAAEAGARRVVRKVRSVRA